MDTLSDLISVVNKKRLSKIDVLDKTFLNSKNENLYYKLYSGIESGKIKTDEAAAQFVYGSHKADPRYKMLKSRLKDKALKSVMLLDAEDAFNNETSRAYLECLTNHNIIEVLIKLNGTSKLVYDLAKESSRKALKFKFYNILKDYSYTIASYHVLNGNEKLFKKEELNFRKYTSLAEKEQQAKFLYFKSCIGFVNQQPITAKLIHDIENNLIQLKILKTDLKIMEINFFYYYLAAQYYLMSNEINKLIEICDEANNIIDSNKFAYTYNRKISIVIYKVNGLLRLKQYAAGINLINSQSNDVLTVSLYNWVVIKEIEFKLYLQDNKIQQSYKVFQEVTTNKYYKRQVIQLTEKWKIYYAYLVFIDNYLNSGDYKFNLSKFLNEVPVNSKDKSGYNFAVRVIEILFYAARKQYNLVFAKIDALRVYRSRYLNDNTYKRNHLFLSVLLKAEKSGFETKVLQNADWKEIALLRERNNIIADWEIVPYEELWDIFVELSKK